MMGEDRTGLSKGFAEAGWQDDLLSYLGRREMMGEDRTGLSKGLEEAGWQDDPFKLPAETGNEGRG
jgi:hypothetical protein